MRSILSSRLFRCILCFFVICCILVNLSPIRAEATAAVLPLAVPVSAPLVIGAIIIGLGIMVGVDSGAFSSLVNDCVSVLSDLGMVVDGCVNAWLVDGRSYIDSDTIEAVRDNLYDYGAITQGPYQPIYSGKFKRTITSDVPFRAGYFYGLFDDGSIYLYYTFASLTSGSCLINSVENSFSRYYNGYYFSPLYYITVTNSDARHPYSSYGEFWGIYNFGSQDPTHMTCATISIPNCDVVNDLFTAGYVAPKIIPLNDAYKTWGNLALQPDPPEGDTGDDDDNSGLIYPIIIPDRETEFPDIKQPDIWEGGDYILDPPEEDPDYTIEPTMEPVDPPESEPAGSTVNQTWLGEHLDGLKGRIESIPDLIIDGITTFFQPFFDFWEQLLEFLSPIPQWFSDVTTAIQNLPDAFTEWYSDILARLDAYTKPPSDMGQFSLDLADYFPFCIPFDLYDFFTCLNADPVAPVIDWVIPLPGGGTYPMEIDLSPFDSVAQLLRRLQLLLFCVGLAFKTRDLIKG